MARRAFELKEPYKDSEFAGSIALRAGNEELRVHELLEQGNGYIVTDDPLEIEALEAFEPLKGADVKDAAAARKESKKSKGGGS